MIKDKQIKKLEKKLKALYSIVILNEIEEIQIEQLRTNYLDMKKRLMVELLQDEIKLIKELVKNRNAV